MAGLTFTEPTFMPFAGPDDLLLTYKGHAPNVTFTGTSYDQTYATIYRLQRRKICLYSEYFDTAVLQAAFTP